MVPETVRKLGRNLDRYSGETIDIESVLGDILRLAPERGWTLDSMPVSAGLSLQGWHRRAAEPRARVYISAGIHGDEPAGPLAVRRLIQENAWPEGIEPWVCPCLNPTGFPLNRRENADGIDLNREYLHLEAPETRAHVEWLKRQPSFDVSLCLHEDWEAQGFYLYELNLDHLPSHAETVIRHVASVCPIDRSPEIEGRAAKGGIIRPDASPQSRPRWPEAFWLATYKTRLSYTMEAPSDFPLETRVDGLAAAVNAIVDQIRLTRAVAAPPS